MTKAEEQFISLWASANFTAVTSAAVCANVAKIIILDVPVELASCFASLLLHFYA